MTREELSQLHNELCSTGFDLMQKKNADYGSTDDPFANFRMAALLHVSPPIGAMLRMQDKMARLVSFIEKGTLQVKEESWKDCCIDLINYSVILCGMLQEKANEQPRLMDTATLLRSIRDQMPIDQQSAFERAIQQKVKVSS